VSLWWCWWLFAFACRWPFSSLIVLGRMRRETSAGELAAEALEHGHVCYSSMWLPLLYMLLE